jgi:DegV family protein with EDD domain
MAEYIISQSYVTDLPASYLEENGLNSLLFNYSVDGVKYYDDAFQRTTVDEFYGMIRDGKEPVTSQINAADYTESFKKILDQGKDIIHVELSSGISGSFNSSRLAVEELKEEYPDRKIVTIDSRSASLGYGLLVHYAVKGKKEGKSFEELVEYLEGLKLKINHWFILDDLQHLKRGGRISGASATIGTMLNIKPMLSMDDEGKLVSIDKAKGRKKALRTLVEIMEKKVVDPDGQDIFISHSYCKEDADYVAKMVKEKYPNVNDVFINYIGPVIGSHTGIGTVGLYFLGDNRSL